MSLMSFQQRFSTEDACVEYFATQRWGSVDGAVCPHCSSKHTCKHNTRGLYTCMDCKKQFTVRVGTIFENSRIPLRKWFVAVYLFTSLKKGISSCQLAKYIEVTQKTAWFMLQRIREVMKDNSDSFSGYSEADEAYIGGKSINKHMHERIALKEKDNKAVVFGVVNRDTKTVKAKHVSDAKANTLQVELYNSVKEGSVLLTDESNAYHSVSQSYNHRTVNHSKGEYCKDGEFEKRGEARVAFKVHTNTIEGFWSQLKRGINGVYHWCSKKHLQRYLNEFSSRYNTRELSDIARFGVWFNGCEGVKLSYVNLVG
jgi:transposase-like protein